MADDEDEPFGGLYEDGHWIWDNVTAGLLFVSDIPGGQAVIVQPSMKVLTAAVEFRDDVDLIEQVRYRRRYQRKILPGDPDVITLQDVKDIAIYTAPTSFLSPMLINMLHLPTTERFIRAMILYTAYYLQVSDLMAQRSWELETKVRTPYSEEIESGLRENICDLRVLAATEFSCMLVGGSETKKYHHMGPAKKRKSLSNKDARLYETLIRITVQIVWLALGRKSFNQIGIVACSKQTSVSIVTVSELEINRLFKSDTFNSVEHTMKTGFVQKMSPEERTVLLGNCLRNAKKLKVCSPLMNEIFSDRPIDFHVLGVGVVNYANMTGRQTYFWAAVAAKEERLYGMNVALGIIGASRKKFDIMLKPLPQAPEKSKSSVASGASRLATTARGSSSKKSGMGNKSLYPDIVIPPRSTKELDLPMTFPDTPGTINRVSEHQRRLWINRYLKLVKARH